MPKNLEVDTFPDPSAILGPPGSHIGFCRRCGVAGGERVPPSPLGWYLLLMLLFLLLLLSLLLLLLLLLWPCLMLLFTLQGVPKKRGISECYSICLTTHLILNIENLSIIHLKVDIFMFVLNTIPFLRDISELRNISFII